LFADATDATDVTDDVLETSTRPVLLRYFAAAADAAGTQEQTIDIPSDSTLAWLRSSLIAMYGESMATAIKNGSFLVDGIAATDDDTPIGAQVDVLPPFAGG
jgi:molybdopterin synthase sulfur carrier subunit